MANFFHPSAKISELASIDVSTRETNTYIGEHSVIDDFVKIKHVGGNGNIRIGNHVYINSGCVLYSGNGIDIGDNVLIGPNCSITPVNHNFENVDIPIRLQGFKESKGGIIIEEDVWIGANVVLIDGCIVRKGCIIGAGAMVNIKTEAYGIYVGSPAALLRYRDK